MRFFNQRKGQSAIEYLMTYGWMLLVVAIVGGAIFATVQSNQEGCNGEIPMALDAQQQGFGVSQFGDDASNTQVVLQNNGDQDVTVESVALNVTSTDSDASIDSEDDGASTLGIGDTGTWSTDVFDESENCNEVEVEITYDVGELTGQTMSGTLEAALQ